jgi:hypothetical protein
MSVVRHFQNTIKVEKAKEFETYKNLPKFSHVPLAVINPSPRKRRSLESSPTPPLKVSGQHTKLGVKRYEPKQIPEHLMRAPQDLSSSAVGLGISSPKKLGASSPGGKGKSLKE